MINQIFIIGRTTKEPEIRTTQSGVSVATFTIACDRGFTNKQGEKETDFVNCVAWRGLADTVAKYLGKGRLVAVVGRLQNRNYETPEGVKKYITEVICSEVQFLDRAKEPQAPPMNKPEFVPMDGTDDDLPF